METASEKILQKLPIRQFHAAKVHYSIPVINASHAKIRAIIVFCISLTLSQAAILSLQWRQMNCNLVHSCPRVLLTYPTLYFHTFVLS